VRKIKIPHPDYETYYGVGSAHKDYDNCADCHMGYVDNDDGERFVNHEWMSPLTHPNIIAENCAECHVDLVAEVRELQGEIKDRTNAIGEALAVLMEELVVVVESDEYTDEELYPIRMKFRDAQFYWDFVFVENSNGAHNPTLTRQSLEKAEILYAQARELLESLIN
jgi:nitrite reductase (cytochrome c-552)